MCNNLHNDYKPIPGEGIGYKIFERKLDRIVARFAWVLYIGEFGQEVDPRKEEVIWDNDRDQELHTETSGFCFFMTKEEALRYWDYTSDPDHDKFFFAEIAYREGLGENAEDNIIPNMVFRTGIARRFKIIKDISWWK